MICLAENAYQGNAIHPRQTNRFHPYAPHMGATDLNRKDATGLPAA